MASATASPAPRNTPRGVAIAPGSTCEFALVLDRAVESRLVTAERLVRSLPAIVGPALLEVGLHLSVSDTFTALVAVAQDDAAARARLAFWSARAGARCLALGDLTGEERTTFRATLVRCPHATSAEAGALAAEAQRFFAAAGSTEQAADADELPTLELAAAGPEWAAVRWSASSGELFVASPLAPPVGDRMRLRVHLAGAAAGGVARIASVRPAEAASPGAPPGFALALEKPPAELLELLDQNAVGGVAHDERRRSHPRYAVRAPARVVPVGVEDPGGGEEELLGAEDPPRFLIENISQGGAFLRTDEPLPLGTMALVTSKLPTGDTLRCEGEVVFAGPRGIGVRWHVDPLAEMELAAVVARTAARKRRALVVDDDAACRKMLAEALHERGFEVMSAADGVAGLQIVSEELLSLDLLVTDLRMPRMDGELLLRTIRRAGGESDLTIVVMTGAIEPQVEKKLAREGADAVLEKELGPRFLAQAAVAVLERKGRGP